MDSRGNQSKFDLMSEDFFLDLQKYYRSLEKYYPRYIYVDTTNLTPEEVFKKVKVELKNDIFDSIHPLIYAKCRMQKLSEQKESPCDSFIMFNEREPRLLASAQAEPPYERKKPLERFLDWLNRINKR